MTFTEFMMLMDADPMFRAGIIAATFFTLFYGYYYIKYWLTGVWG